MKILLFANAPWCASGYGQQCAHLLHSFTELGYDVDIAASFGFSGGGRELPTGGTIYGMGYIPPHGEDRLPLVMQEVKPDIIVSLCNSWALDTSLWAQLCEYSGATLYQYDPIERLRMPPRQRAFYEETPAILVPMTEWARSEAERNGVATTPQAIPHTVDDAYTPGDADRKVFGLPDDGVIIGMVGANSGGGQGWMRKGYDTTFLALAELIDEQPDRFGNVTLWCHCASNDSTGGTDLLTELRTQAGLSLDNLLFTPLQLAYQPLTTSGLAVAYRTMDLFLSPGKAEGFGVPTVEAQACGTPTVATDMAGNPELMVLGEMIAAEPCYDTTQQGYFWVPRKDELKDAIKRQLAMPPSDGERDELSAMVRRKFSRTRVRDELWQPLLAGCAAADPQWHRLPSAS